MDLDNSTIVLILYCVLAFVLAFYPAYLIFPRFIRRMKALGNTGKDADDRPAGHLRLEHSPPVGGFMLHGVNKRGNIQVAISWTRKVRLSCIRTGKPAPSTSIPKGTRSI